MVEFPEFDKIPGLHPILVKNLRAMNFKTMTEIQALTWEAASSGRDVLGRARTGTGKTVSFLLPALQQLLLLSNDESLAQQDNNTNATIHMLVLSPTRELAMQIDDEAQKLSRGNKKNIRHQVVYGGSSRPKDVAQFERRVPTILVATPGRLRDHLDNTTVKGRPFSSLFRKTSILVLDETDRLLDMGFQKEVNEIIRFLPPKEQRQTLLFSATVPNEVKAVMKATMKDNFVTADCIHDTDPATHTNEQVEQRHVIVPYKTRLVTGTVQVIWKLIEKAKSDKETLKMVVFFNTANLVGYYAALFNNGLDIPVLELHSRKSQSYRTKTADKFRTAEDAILFTSDVSARGVDYPGVTNVVQVGIAETRESYIHRLGRTGRAGKVGEGLLVLYDLEKKFLDKLNGIDVPVHEEFQSMIDSAPPDVALMNKLQPILDDIRNQDGSNDLCKDLESAYRSMLGFYNGKLSKQLGVKDPAMLIDFVNEFAKQGGCAELPGIEKKTIGKMGLRYTTGLNITPNLARQDRSGANNGRGRGSKGSSGGSGGGRGGGNNNPRNNNNNNNNNGGRGKEMSGRSVGGRGGGNSNRSNNNNNGGRGRESSGGTGGGRGAGNSNRSNSNNGGRGSHTKRQASMDSASSTTPEAKKSKPNQGDNGRRNNNRRRRGGSQKASSG